MGLLAQGFRNLVPVRTQPGPVSVTTAQQYGTSMLGGNYATYARDGYMKNELIFSAIELRATSAAEPHVIGRRKVSAARRRQLRAWMVNNGVSALDADYHVTDLHEDVSDHPAVELCNRPNPYMSRFQFWSSVILHRDLAGNAYVWKGRSVKGAPPVELWLLRPDRVRIIPGPGLTVAAYRYSIGQSFIELPAEDVIHFRTRHPLDDYYGMPPLMAASGRVDIDNYMRDFLGAFFRNGGQPGAILSVKNRLSQEAKDEIKTHFRSNYGGPAGWFELMVLDTAEATFTPMTMQLGQRGLVMPELNAMSEARLAMVFGIPLSILGALTGQESSSYANKRQDWQVLWDITLAPLYADLDDTLNLSLLPEFTGLDELLFDLSQIKALQEDVDLRHERARKNFGAGGWSFEEFRAETGKEPTPASGTFFVPANLIPTPASRLGEMPAPADMAARSLMATFAQARLPEEGARTGRPRLEEDQVARDLYARGEELRREHPGMTVEQIADRLGLAGSTYKRYRATFRE